MYWTKDTEDGAAGQEEKEEDGCSAGRTCRGDRKRCYRDSRDRLSAVATSKISSRKEKKICSHLKGKYIDYERVFKNAVLCVSKLLGIK